MRSIARRHRRLGTVALVATALVVAGCSSPGSSTSTAPVKSSATPGATAGPKVSAATVPASSDAWLVVGKVGDDRLHVILASTGQSIYDLPAGVPDATWARILTATTDGATTRVQDLAVQPGSSSPSQTVTGAWRLPKIGADPMPAGVSADGRTIVLVPAADPAAVRAAKTTDSRFAIVRRTFDAEPRIITLPGGFDFDALSPDGTALYVIEHLAGPPEAHYQVRAVDVATGRLRDGVVADKSNLNETMGGYPIAQLRRDGMVYTLYRGAEHPFIHALSTVDSWAICIDLTATGADDASAALDWGLAASPDGWTMVAANATLGVVALISPSDLRVARSSTFAPAAVGGTGITLAKFGHQATGVTGRRAVIGPDGRIYVAGKAGIVILSKDDLEVTGRLAAGSVVDAMAVTPDGDTLYAMTPADHGIVKIDVATGRVLGNVGGGGYDRLVAVVPW